MADANADVVAVIGVSLSRSGGIVGAKYAGETSLNSRLYEYRPYSRVLSLKLWSMRALYSSELLPPRPAAVQFPESWSLIGCG